MKELIKKTNQTPIEIMLKVDQEGKTTAKALYEFLELSKNNYTRWCKKNILENSFAEENIDFWAFLINEEWGGQATTDYKLTASFAKKLAMSCQNERGEQAREYFIKVEEKLKQTISKKATSSNDEKAKLLRAEAMSLFKKQVTATNTSINDLEKTKLEIQKTRAEAMALNAKNRAFNTLMKSLDNKKLSPIAVQVFGLKGLEG